MEAARDGLREAVDRNPDDAIRRNDLAVVLCLLGDYLEAIQHIERVVETRPELTVAYVNGAVIAGLLRGYEAALPWVDAALDRDPDHLAAMLLRSGTLAKLGRGREAVDAALRAVASHPQSAEAHEILGAALQSAGLYDEALSEFDLARSLGHGGLAGVRKAMMLLELGRPAEALDELSAVISEHPMLAVAWYTKCLALDFHVGALDVAAMENVLRDSTSLTFNDRIQLHFAIGRARIARGDNEVGFAFLEKANAMKRASIEYDLAADERRMREAAATFSADFLGRHGGRGNPSDLPVFVVGMPRSGTTLIEQILASHPSVFGAGELSFIGAAAEGLDGTRSERFLEIAEDYLVALSVPKPPDVVRVVDKMPFNFLHVGIIRLMLPNARIIHCRRDPLDTCLSSYFTLFDSTIGFCYDQRELGRYFRAYEELMRHWRAVVPPDRFIEVEYENVVADLEGQARRLIDFCGLPWDERCLDFHATERPVLTASMNQVRRPLYSTSIGRSRRYVAYLGPLVSALEGKRDE